MWVTLSHRFIFGINALNRWVGRGISWLMLLIVLIIIYDVWMRYLFNQGSVFLQELQWHLFAVSFLLAAAYTYQYEGHVRVDIIDHSRWMNARKRAWIDMFGDLFMLIPFSILVIYSSSHFVWGAWSANEGSPDPGGIPYRYILKSMVIVGFSLLTLQGVSHFLEKLLFVLGYDTPPANPHTSSSTSIEQ